MALVLSSQSLSLFLLKALVAEPLQSHTTTCIYVSLYLSYLSMLYIILNTTSTSHTSIYHSVLIQCLHNTTCITDTFQSSLPLSCTSQYFLLAVSSTTVYYFYHYNCFSALHYPLHKYHYFAFL